MTSLCDDLITITSLTVHDKKVAFYWEIRILNITIERETGQRISSPRNPSSGWIQSRNPNPDFMDFLFTVRLGNPKKDLQNYSREQRSSSFLLIMRALARPLFLIRTVFRILFRISQSNSKTKIQQQISQR